MLLNRRISLTPGFSPVTSEEIVLAVKTAYLDAVVKDTGLKAGVNEIKIYLLPI